MSSFSVSKNFVLPLSGYPMLTTSDLEKVSAVLENTYHPMTLDVPTNRRDFVVTYNHIFLDGISISATQNTSHLHVSSGPLETSYILQFLPLRGAARIKCRGQESLIHGMSGAMLSPLHDAVNDQFEGNSQIAIRIERDALESCFTLLSGQYLKQPLEFELSVDLRNPILYNLQENVKFFVEQFDRETSILQLPQVKQQLREVFLISLLSSQPHNAGELLKSCGKDSGSCYVRKAEEYIKEHILDEFSMQELAKAVGVNLRTLQMGFRKHRNYTMRDFIKKRRLALARDKLLHPNGRNVSEIAYACGFYHLSQFSAEYNRTYKEKPSETLARGNKRM